MQWTAVVPVKALAQAKSRLGDPTAELAFAFAQDTVSALLDTAGIDEVIVATGDPRVHTWSLAQGCIVVDDSTSPGLLPAIAAASVVADPTRGRAVVLADLPCLTTEQVRCVLDLAEDGRPAFVADAAGTGTSMWLAGPSHPWDCRFGPDSRAAHRATGARDLVELHPDVDLRRARRDVDTAEDLHDALNLGVGSATRQAAGTPVTVVTDVTGVTDVTDTAPGFVRLVDDEGRPRMLAMDRLVGLRQVRAGQRLLLCGEHAYLP